jgi:predicted dienelactone hydrolase
MKQIKLVAMIGLMIFLFVACSNEEETKISQWEVPDTEFPLAEPGPYFAGVRVYSIIDESRESRKIKLYVWYPAKEETDALSPQDAPAYQNDAPYPLILTGSDTGGSLFGDHLVSHGYVMAIVEPPTTATWRWDYEMIDNARDLLFALDQLADNPPKGLEGIIDTDHVGVAGYSGDGDTAFAVSGARLDPEFYQSQCEQLQGTVPNAGWWYAYACSHTENWAAFASAVGNTITESDDGLWQPITDGRIRAVAPMGLGAPFMYSERSLAAIDRPMLVLIATDELHPILTHVFEQVGSPEKVMISFINRDHMMVLNSIEAERMNHLVTAFFGYYLQGREDYAKYFSEDFIAQFDDLAWGFYEGE